MAGSDKNNKLGFNGPSFSNVSDISRIKGALDLSRAEQTNNRRGIASDETLDDETNNTRPSDLEEKEGLDKKENTGTKDNKSSGGLVDKVASKLSGSNSSNPLNEVNPIAKAKKTIIKIKIYLIIGGVCLCFFFFFSLVIILFLFIGSLGNGNDDYGDNDEETVIKDTYYNEYGEYPSYCIDDECVVEPEEEETKNTEESTSETTEETSEEGSGTEEETEDNSNDVVKPYHTNPPKADENVPMVE